jgi:glycosyltransferase involved in cell wall biosynthesis
MYPPHHAGGYELAWQQAMRHARARGHSVRILTTDYCEEARDEEDTDVHRTLRWYWDLERYEFPQLNLLQRLRLERHNAAELHRHLEAFRPDVVAWWSMGCMSLSLVERVRRARIPAVFVVHDDWLVYGWKHDQWLRTWIGPKRQVVGHFAERLCGVPTRVDVQQAGPFVFNSCYTLERARAGGVHARMMTVVHPGVDGRFLDPLPPPPWRWRLVYVGRIDRQKGVDTAVAALALLPPEAALSVWGSGDDRYVAEMKRAADRLGVGERLRFEGSLDAERLRSVYADADVVVFPVRWNEPFGLVPLEAMGAGRPVVTTARGGTAEFVRDGSNALVFPADDPDALAACVMRLAEDEALRSRLCEQGACTAANYTVADFARRTVDEICRAAGVRGTGARFR